MEIERVSYRESETIKLQGNRDDIKPYLKKGYKIVKEEFGNFILGRKAAIFAHPKDAPAFNIKNEVLDYYDRKQVSQKLFDKFQKDFVSGKVEFAGDGMIKSK